LGNRSFFPSRQSRSICCKLERGKRYSNIRIDSSSKTWLRSQRDEGWANHMKKTEEPLKLVTIDEAIEGLRQRIEELEKIQGKGGMTVPKMRDTARRLRTAKAKLRQLESALTSATRKPKKRRSAGTPATYLEKLAALGVRVNSWLVNVCAL
jgi:beta-phosphoglucomutase-like phosphatase (HAD superfamily)